MATKNLGQVSGLWIGTSAPSNTSLIWYDSTPAIRCHKVYSASLSAWVVLDQSSISSITYTELKNLAKGTGLTQGSWYKITDQGNILALAITTTKVQYVDVNNNFVIDDLAASATYAVTSSNLLIDDISGVWDADNNLLKFSFKETAHDGNTDNDFVFGKKQRSGVWSLAKYKLSSFISSVTGNSITWNKGFFFNFLSALRGQYDVSGGVVSKDTYDTQKAALQQSIDNVASSNQAILNSAKNYTDGKTAANEVYSKALPSSPTSGTAIDIVQGDTLSGIITKIYRWIAQFKVATGIKVSQSFAPTSTVQAINNNDTVDSALRKVQKHLNDIPIVKTGEDIKSGTQDWESHENPVFNYKDNVFVTLSKIISKFGKIRRDDLYGGSWLMPVKSSFYSITDSSSEKYLPISDLISNEGISPILISSPSTSPVTVKISFKNIDSLISNKYTRFQLFLFNSDTNNHKRLFEFSFPFSSEQQIISGYDMEFSVDVTMDTIINNLWGKIVTFERIKTQSGVFTWNIVSVSPTIGLIMSF